MTTYRDPTGLLTTGSRLGRGGEGEVFALADGSPRALKIYTTPDASREAKIRSMIAAGLAASCPGVAFPETTASALDGSFAGFTMALVKGGQPIHELYSPASRRQVFPTADWRFLVRTAANVARVFGRVHATGAVIGDVNGSGILVSQRAVVSLIDADSFQWGVEHPCRVGVPEFTPPELQGRSLEGVQRTIEHDGFGLAVLIFHLLFLGRHPAAGIPQGREIALGDAIRQHLFAYSTIRRSRVRPPRGTLLLSDLPLGIATLFERAFAGVSQRPLPREWMTELEALETGVTPCERNRTHHRPTISDCPWCRIDRVTGVPSFAASAAAVADHAVRARPSQSHSDAMKVLMRARKTAGDGIVPPARSRVPGPSPQAIEAARQLSRTGTGPVSPSADLTTIRSRFVAAYNQARNDMEAAVDGWRTRIGARAVARLATEFAEELSQQADTARRHSLNLSRVEETLRQELIGTGLRQRTLESSMIPGIGGRGVARLAAAGISNAGDISRAAVETIHGLGERSALLLNLWRGGVTAEIARQTVVTKEAVSARLNALHVARRLEEVSEAEKLRGLTVDLEAALGVVAAQAARPDARVEKAMTAFDQASADLRHLGMMDQYTLPPGEARPVATPLKPAKNARAACPTCGGPMVKRWARSGSAPNRFFQGCARYPICSGSRPFRGRTS